MTSGSCERREGGSFRISLTCDTPNGTGKTAAHGDTYHGHFVELVPNEQVVEVMGLETADPQMRGEVTVTFTVSDAGGGTDVLAAACTTTCPPAAAPTITKRGEVGRRVGARETGEAR